MEGLTDYNRPSALTCHLCSTKLTLLPSSVIHVNHYREHQNTKNKEMDVFCLEEVARSSRTGCTGDHGCSIAT